MTSWTLVASTTGLESNYQLSKLRRSHLVLQEVDHVPAVKEVSLTNRLVFAVLILFDVGATERGTVS